jgi:serine/threonine-protein kinase RsbW
MEHLRELVDAVVRVAADVGASESVRHDVRLAVEEACTNVIVHGYGSRAIGPITVTVTIERDEIIVQIVDRAPPFAPDDAPRPPVYESWQTRHPGGLGWHLIRSVMDRVEYRRAEPDRNILTLTKRLDRASDGDPSAR